MLEQIQFVVQKLNYNHTYAVDAALIALPEDYYSSATNYAGLTSPVEIAFESQQLFN